MGGMCSHVTICRFCRETDVLSCDEVILEIFEFPNQIISINDYMLIALLVAT